MTRFLLFLFACVAAHGAEQMVEWVYPLPKDPTGFVLERGTGNNAQTFKEVASLPGYNRAFLNTGLTKKTKYSYRMRAYISRSDGTTIYSQYSNVVSKPAK